MRQQSASSSLMALSDAADEFFDVPEASDDDALENDWDSNTSSDLSYVVRYFRTFDRSVTFLFFSLLS